MNAPLYGHVVVGLDRSPQAWAALKYGAALAERRHLPLKLLHAYEPSQFGPSPVAWNPDVPKVLRNAAERLIGDAADLVSVFHPEVLVEVRLEPGSAVEQLIEESARAHAVVVGARGAGGFPELLVGSVTMHVATHASGPVIAVPTPADEAIRPRGVVVGVDGSAASEAAVGFAFDAAADLDEPLTAVHAWYDVTRTGVGRMMPMTYDPAEIAADERLRLAEALSGWQEKFPDVRVQRKVLLGHPVPALLRAASGARMLVVGCRGRGAVRSVVQGSVSHGVLHHAKVPVAVVHSAC